jgi:heme-degrading monooxygenase HmoA
VGISLWDTKEDAEAYNRAEYPEVLKALSEVVEGTPTVETFEVANSTLHKIAAKAA